MTELIKTLDDITLSDLQIISHAASRAKGFYDDPNRPVSEMIIGIHSEVSEVWEHVRRGKSPTHTWYRDDGKPEGIPSELADIAIFLGDLSGYLGVSLTAAVHEKWAYNQTRPHRHGGKR